MGVARSSFYAVSSGAPDETAIVAEVRAICAGFPAYGYRRVGAELRHRGRVVNAKKLRRNPARAGPEPPAAAAPGGHHDERPWQPDLPEPRQRLRGARARRALGERHHLRRHQGGLRLSRRRCSTPGRGAWSATRSTGISTPASPPPRSAPPSPPAGRCRDACSTPTAGCSTPRSRTGRCSPPTASSAR